MGYNVGDYSKLEESEWSSQREMSGQVRGKWVTKLEGKWVTKLEGKWVAKKEDGGGGDLAVARLVATSATLFQLLHLT